MAPTININNDFIFHLCLHTKCLHNYHWFLYLIIRNDHIVYFLLKLTLFESCNNLTWTWTILSLNLIPHTILNNVFTIGGSSGVFLSLWLFVQLLMYLIVLLLTYISYRPYRKFLTISLITRPVGKKIIVKIMSQIYYSYADQHISPGVW